jgi:hypothetical protein
LLLPEGDGRGVVSGPVTPVQRPGPAAQTPAQDHRRVTQLATGGRPLRLIKPCTRSHHLSERTPGCPIASRVFRRRRSQTCGRFAATTWADSTGHRHLDRPLHSRRDLEPLALSVPTIIGRPGFSAPAPRRFSWIIKELAAKHRITRFKLSYFYRRSARVIAGACGRQARGSGPGR